VKSIKEAVFKNNAKILMITSPNNPDGSVISREEIEELLELPCLVVLDEAYIEFYGVEHSLVGEVPKRQNLIVLRTFSKRAALAGLRVGYGVFPLHLIEFLWRMKQPYNVSVVAELAACAALSNPDYLEDVKNALVSERENMFEMMSKFSFLEPYESQSNFILCR
jgi:histidinol-phosphate aminotransferase